MTTSLLRAGAHLSNLNKSAPVKKAANRMRREVRVAGVLFLSPAALLFTAFIAGPVVAVVVLSLFSWDMLSTPRFIGLENYTHLFSDSVVLSAFINTAAFTVTTVVLHMVVGLALAVAVNGMTSRFMRYFVRTTVFFPVLISWAACALIWKYVLDPDSGFVNFYLRELGLDPPNWFLSKAWALPTMIGMDLWRTLGFTFIILLAGLQTVPKQLYEAARIDGANGWQQFWNVTVPMLSPTILFTIVVSVMGAFQIVDPMLIITSGGPGTSTLSAVQLIYYKAFRDFQMGYASAIAVLLAVAIMVFTLLQLRLSRRWVTYDR